MSTPPDDAYDDLLRATRGLHREQAQAREAWFSKLPHERKEELLFELEILLKGLACFANPRNHPGPPRRVPVVAQDFREHLTLVREGLGRIVWLARSLTAERERAFVFQRYLETVLPDDSTRTRFVREAMTQDTPEGSLVVLRHAMTNLLEVTSGVARMNRVPFRLFYALLGVAQREIAQSAYFNPLSALEFRPEFDRIVHPQMLDLMRAVPGTQARRLVALTFLSLFRMLRYLRLVERTVRVPTEGAKRTAAIVYLVMSVLRSDARALSGYLRQRTGPLLADSYEAELLRLPASQLAERFEQVQMQGEKLLELKATLEGIGSNVRLEIRRAFEHDFPAPDTTSSHDDLARAVQRCAANLRPALQNAVLFLGKSLGARFDERGIFDDATARRVLAERLRRDVWMFAQIVRAFAQKARAVRTGEARWSSASPLQFTREFLGYFRAMGYPLLRTADYPRVDEFLRAMAGLEESDLYDVARLEPAIDEAERFYGFLTELFAAISRRDELAGVPFDRRGAAEALKLYLADSPRGDPPPTRAG